MKQLIEINLTTRATDWTPPTLEFGETLTVALRFVKNVGNNLVEPNLTFNAARALIGYVDARPAGGEFALQIGPDPQTVDNTTDLLKADCTPTQLAAAINAKATVVATYGTAVARKFDGSWLIKFGTQAAEVPIKVVDNALWPVAFGQVFAWQQGDKWVHELRLTQAAVAFTSGVDVQLPPLPGDGSGHLEVVEHGGTSGSYTWNTVQKLYIPPDYRGAYRIKKGFQRTQLISPDAGTDEIQAALIAAFGNTFVVTLPLSQNFDIELAGDFAGTDVAAMDVEGGPSPAGDLVLSIPLDREELRAILRRQVSVDLPLSINIIAQEDGGEAKEIAALTVPVTVRRSLFFPEEEEAPTIDWLRFPSKRTYTPPGVGNVLTGEKIQEFIRGDGSATTFVIGHLLNSRSILTSVRENFDGGRELVNGTDYRVTIDGLSQVTVTALTGAPGIAGWAVDVIANKEIASWAGDLTVTEAQVTGLVADLASLDARITSLETLLPGTASTSGTTSPIANFKIELTPASEILFTSITDPTKLGKHGAFMLPAIHRTTNDGALPTSPFPTPTANALYTSSAATLIPSGNGHIRDSLSTAGGFVGSDGRINYPVTRSGTTNSYFPTPYERVFCKPIPINDLMFAQGQTLTFLFKLALQTFFADSEAQWTLVIEQGTITSEVNGPPNTFDTNLLNIDWNTAAPLVRQVLDVTGNLVTHGFGCTIKRTGTSTFTANGLIYQRILNADAAAPTSSAFALRARLINFDTRNNAQNARGWLRWALLVPDNNGVLGIVIA